MNYAFECILGIPWLSRYQPKIDWLSRSVKRRSGYDVSEVFTHLLVASSDWPHVRVVNELATTSSQHRESDGPLCAVCSVTLTEPQNEAVEQRFSHTQTSFEQGFPILNEAVEQRLPHTSTSFEQGFPILNEAVEQRLPHTSTSDEQRLPINFEAVEQSLPHISTSDEQRLPINIEAVEQGLPRTSPSDEQRLPINIEAVEQGLPQTNEAVEDELPLLIDDNGQTMDPHETGVVETELPRLMGGTSSSCDSDVPVSSRGSRRKRKRKKGARRSPRRRNSRQHADAFDSVVTESVCALEYVEGSPHRGRYIKVASPPVHRSATEAVSEEVLEALPKSAEPKSAREERFAAQSWDALHASGNPVYNIAREYADIFPEKIPAELPADRDVQHEIDLVPGSKYCVTRQWPLPRDQVIAIDKFCEGRRKAGHVRESISPHSSPTFCVKKATGGWRIVHAFNKLNDATIPAQTPIPRKDMVLHTMSGSEIYGAIDLTDGFYQILMRDSDIPFTAVSTPSGMLWEWLVMPQGLKNAPATFNRMVTQVLRPLRDFAPSYFDDIFVHSRAEQKLSATEKCVFCSPEIPVLGCYVSKEGVRADPEKISSICSWPTPRNQIELRQWLGLANYLHKYTKNYAELIQPLSTLLKKDAAWLWTAEHQSAFDPVKKFLSEAPVLMLPDDSKLFNVVCDAINFAIGCALMQFDDEGRERVVSFQSRQMKPSDKNYPSIYTDHASLRTAVKSPHLSQRMARWLSFFAEYNFVVHYKPGKNNILADALSRRPDYDPRRDRGHQPDNVDDDVDICACCVELGLNAMISIPVLSIRTQIAESYANDSFYAGIINYLRDPSEKLLAKLTKPTRDNIKRYALDGPLLTYTMDVFNSPRVVIPADDDLRARLVHEFHDSPAGGHLGREKMFAAISRVFFLDANV
ncbi:unnamed protein product [Peronospora effusa]|nr:unnamed protein product [Peronospora effusa]